MRLRKTFSHVSMVGRTGSVLRISVDHVKDRAAPPYPGIARVIREAGIAKLSWPKEICLPKQQPVCY